MGAANRGADVARDNRRGAFNCCADCAKADGLDGHIVVVGSCSDARHAWLFGFGDTVHCDNGGSKMADEKQTERETKKAGKDRKSYKSPEVNEHDLDLGVYGKYGPAARPEKSSEVGGAL